MGFMNYIRSKALSFLGAQSFIGNGSNPLFGMSARSAADDVFGYPTPQDMENLAATHPVVRRCIELQAIKMLEAKLVVGRETEDGEWESFAQETMARKLLMRPNKAMAWSILLQYMVGNYRSTGVSYVWAMRTRNGNLFDRRVLPSPRDAFGAPQPDSVVEGRGELWPIPTSWIEQVMPDGTTETGTGSGMSCGPYAKSYTIKVPGKSRIENISPADMIVWRNPDYRDFNSAVSSVALAWRNARLDETDENYVAEHLTNIRIPGVVINVAGGLSKNTKEDIRAIFEQRLGIGRRGKPIFLEGQDAKLQTISPVGDMGHAGMTSLNETRICTAMATPPILVGCWAGLQNSPWSNIGEARKIFAQFTLIPMWLSLGEALSHTLIDERSRGDGWQVAFDWDDVSDLQPDMIQGAQRAQIVVGGGFATVNEGRKMAGLQPRPDGEVYLRGLATSPVPVGKGNESPEDMPPATPEEHMAGIDTKEFDPDQPRDENGQWTGGASGGAGGASSEQSSSGGRGISEEVPASYWDDQLKAERSAKRERKATARKIAAIKNQMADVKAKIDAIDAANATIKEDLAKKQAELSLHREESEKKIADAYQRVLDSQARLAEISARAKETRSRLDAIRGRKQAKGKSLDSDAADELSQIKAALEKIREESERLDDLADALDELTERIP